MNTTLDRCGHVQVIVNPISGRAGSRVVVAALCRQMRRAGYAVDVHTTRGPGEARTIARRLCRKSLLGTARRCHAPPFATARNATTLVVCGGDGTISEVVDGLLTDDIPVLLVPGGTENLLATYFGIPLDAATLWDVFRRGREVRLDVALRDDRRFLMVAGVGSDAEVVRLLSRQRRGHISYWNYVRPIWQTLWHYHHPNLWVEADGTLIHQGPGWALVGNVPQYAMGLQLLHRARPDDGLLDVCVLPFRGNARLLWHLWKVLLGQTDADRTIVYKQARRVRIWSDRQVPLEVDGDVAGSLPAQFRLAPQKVRFLVPNTWQPPQPAAQSNGYD